MKRAAILIFLLLLGACVMHQVTSSVEKQPAPQSVEESCDRPKAVPAAPQTEPARIESPVSHEDAYELGIESIAAGQYEAAVVQLLRAVKAFPGDAEAGYALGFAYLRLGEYENAVQYFTRSHAASSDVRMQAKALVGRGYALHALGRYSDAVKAYSVALQVVPGYIKAFYNRGCSYGEMGDHPNAVADFERVLKLSPDYPGARNNLKYYLSKE